MKQCSRDKGYYSHGKGRRKLVKAFQPAANAVFYHGDSIEKSAETGVDGPILDMSRVLNPTEIYLSRVTLRLPTEVGVLTSSA